MRRILAVAMGIGAFAGLALLVPTGAGAAQTTTTLAPTNVEAMCLKLPGLQADVTQTLAQSTAALTTVNDTLTARRSAMTAAMTSLADAVGSHLAALDGNGDPAATGPALRARQADYVTTVVAWSKARKQAFDGERTLVFGELQKTLLDSLGGSACP